MNAVAPGSIQTDWIEKWKLTPHEIEAIASETLLKRIGKPEEVADAGCVPGIADMHVYHRTNDCNRWRNSESMRLCHVSEFLPLKQP